MTATPFDLHDIDIAWCPGCGNFSILNILKQALAELEVDPRRLVVASGIGQAAKAPHYMLTHFFNGLHGRALPAATAIKAANPGLLVIAEGGDGDMYGEGGNHFMHTARRNPDIVHLVHNNMVYGLTKGQASPTSQPGFKTPVQVEGVSTTPFNPLAVAISLKASFVSRIFCGDREQSVAVLKQAITHRGYALVDILQPCVTFNKINTFRWFKENSYYLDDSHDPHDRNAAFARSTEEGRLVLGVVYINEQVPVFEDGLAAYRSNPEPLFRRQVDYGRLRSLIDEKRTMG